MVEGTISIADIITSLSLKTSRTPQETRCLLSSFIEAIDECPGAHFDPVAIIQALLPYFTPENPQLGTVTEPNFTSKETLHDVHQTRFSGAAVTALASVLRRCGAINVRSDARMQALLITCWPSIWLGLLYYARALLREGTPPPLFDIDSPAHTFTAIVTLLQMYAEVDFLAAMVRNTPKVINLIIALWTLEVDPDSRDMNGRFQSQLSRQLAEMFPSPTDCPPTAARLLHLHIFSGEWVLSESISGDRLKEIATTGLAHIKKSLSALSRPMNLLTVFILENLYINLSTLRRLLSTPLIPLLIIQRSTLVVTEALVSVTSQPLEAASADAITKCIAQICGYLYKYLSRDGLPGLVHSLEFGLLVGLFKAYPWLEWRSELEDRKTAVEACEILLVVHMPKHFIYISVLRQVHKFLVRRSKMINPSFHSYREIWPVFHKLAMARLQLATASELETEQCNSPECQKPSSMRCSSCLSAVYCSQKCQVAAWNSHREICHARATALQNGITPDLTTEDVRFALRVVRHDLEHNNFKADICTKWSESSTLPLCAGIDYSVFPPTLNFDAPSIVKDRMTSYAAIYVVFPQGKEGKEYYMCDLGLTRGPTDTDEETIKVVTQIISTQQIPEFLPIN